MVRKFLSADAMDLKTWTAGLFVLLYGIQLTHIVTISREQIDASSRPERPTTEAEPIELQRVLRKCDC